MAAYRLELTPRAARDLAALPPLTRSRIDERLAELAIGPRAPGARKLLGIDALRVRVGDFRIVYEVDDRRRIVEVFRIRHRREAYRGMR